MLFLLTKALNLMSLNSTPDFLLLKLHGSIYLNINFECSKVSSAFHRRTGRMPVDTLTRRRKSQWIGYTLRQNNNCIAGYAMQWNPLSHTRETEEWPALELRDTEQYRKSAGFLENWDGSRSTQTDNDGTWVWLTQYAPQRGLCQKFLLPG